tara:strand:- start:2168 stop:2434 length:267 start_codon:yes stop_codon:yes gene_type:complete
VFTPLKAAYHNQVKRLEQGGVNTISKKHFTFLYSLARKKVFTPKNIKASFAISNLFPFNPDKVLRSIPALVNILAISTADDVKVRPYL